MLPIIAEYTNCQGTVHMYACILLGGTLGAGNYYISLNCALDYVNIPADEEGTLFIESVFILSQPIIRLDEVDLQVTGITYWPH